MIITPTQVRVTNDPCRDLLAEAARARLIAVGSAHDWHEKARVEAHLARVHAEAGLCVSAPLPGVAAVRAALGAALIRAGEWVGDTAPTSIREDTLSM